MKLVTGHDRKLNLLKYGYKTYSSGWSRPDLSKSFKTLLLRKKTSLKTDKREHRLGNWFMLKKLVF
jgi:hypothetical protein